MGPNVVIWGHMGSHSGSHARGHMGWSGPHRAPTGGALRAGRPQRLHHDLPGRRAQAAAGARLPLIARSRAGTHRPWIPINPALQPLRPNSAPQPAASSRLVNRDTTQPLRPSRPPPPAS
eukprot:7212321-Prymnesium_polylepis.1